MKIPKMIQLIGWIFLLSLFSMAFSDTTFETGLESLVEGSLTTVNTNEEPEKTTSLEIPSTSAKSNSDSSLATDFTTEKTQLSKNSTTLVEISPDKPISMSLKTYIPEPAYISEITVTYQSTTPNLKESSPDEIQTESSTLSNSDKNLYYDARTTTEYGISHEMSAESPDMTADDDLVKSTTSMGLISERGINPLENDATVTDLAKEATSIDEIVNSNTNTEEFDRKSTGIESYIFSKTNLPQNAPLENDSKTEETGAKEINISIQNYKTTSGVQSSTLDDKQTESTIEVQSSEASEQSTPNYEETSFVLMKNRDQTEGVKEIIDVSEESVDQTETSTDKDISFPDLITAHINDYNFENISVDATETNNNSTRIPKRIQGSEERYPEGRIRPAHPDPGYANRPEVDIVRPYRPDSPIHQYPYYRPTPDYRTPLIREDKDFTRPPRPDPEYQRVSFRPNYGYSKPSQEDTSSSKPSSTSDPSAKPYRPSFSRPYHSQSSFGRPYRPDYHRPASKPSDDYPVTPKTTDIKGISSQDSEVSEHSRADYDYTRQSEAVSGYTKNYHSDVRPSVLKPDSGKPYRPTYDTEISMHKPTSSDNTENRDSVKVSKPDMETNKPSSFYPRPGFGNNYQTSETSVRPFSIGTVTSAKNLTRVEFIKADCFDNHMKVTMRFNGTFNGLVYSSGYAQDSSCSYVNGSGRNHYEFYIRLNRCGTLGQQEVAEQRLRSASRRRQERAQYLVNTVTVQYNPVIEEDIDEHFRVTCEYGYDFWKTVTFPVVSVESSAVKVRTGSPVVFTLPPPQCNMEIRSGFGPSGTRVGGPVNVGDPLTLVIHMKSESTGFDILVSNCYAHNGAQKRLQLIDSNGCVVQEKLVSPFRGVSSPDRSQQVTLYSYLKAFRFTGSPALYIECDVHMCHGSCPPQRCYWRHLYKRSAQEMTTEATTTPDNLISESISLFQALEVRHDEADSPNMLALRNSNGMDTDDMVCLRTGGFAAMFACLLLLLIMTTFAAVCMCLRMRKMKRFVESPDTKHFVEFDGHVPLK